MKSLRLALSLLLLLESSLARPFGVSSSFGSPSRRTPPASILPLRGGAIEVDEEDAHMPPRISAQDMAIALRWTGEVNRRLQEGTRSSYSEVSTRLVPPIHEEGRHAMRGGESAPASLPLTLFHAKSSRPNGNGASRWGPDLEAYVAHICVQLNLPQDASAELSLALMYLDRASSAETPRSNGVPPVPFLQPRTVHRVVLAALLLAAHTTQGWPLPVLMERVESLGVPPDHLAQMLQWMHGALGDPGYFVADYSIQAWRNVLGETSRLRDLLVDEEKGITALPPIVPTVAVDTGKAVTTAADAPTREEEEEEPEAWEEPEPRAARVEAS